MPSHIVRELVEACRHFEEGRIGLRVTAWYDNPLQGICVSVTSMDVTVRIWWKPMRPVGVSCTVLDPRTESERVSLDPDGLGDLLRVVADLLHDPKFSSALRVVCQRIEPQFVAAMDRWEAERRSASGPKWTGD